MKGDDLKALNTVAQQRINFTRNLAEKLKVQFLEGRETEPHLPMIKTKNQAGRITQIRSGGPIPGGSDNSPDSYHNTRGALMMLGTTQPTGMYFHIPTLCYVLVRSDGHKVGIRSTAFDKDLLSQGIEKIKNMKPN
jgi:hypothetical protein